MSTHGTEQLLRETLQAKAVGATADLTVADVRRDALAQRRRSRWRTAGGLAAAAAVLVGVPTALYLGSGDRAPSPAPSPSINPSVSPSPTPTKSALTSIPRGKDPQVTYLHDGVVHLFGGGTTRLPAAATDVTEFTPYHGGWLVLDSVGGLVQYDHTGAVVRRWHGDDVALALEADQLRTAYSTPGRMHVGSSTGMGGGEVSWPLASARVVGFVKDEVGNDDVVFTGGGQVGYDHNGTHRVPGLSSATATASGSDLIGGLAPDGVSGRVVDLAGHVRWTSTWLPDAFSPDGRYVAAVLAPGGVGTDLAILDARSGHVVSRVSLRDRGLEQFGPPVWEDSDSAVLLQVKDDTSEAILRVGADGRLTRASDVEPSAGQPTWAFATTP